MTRLNCSMLPANFLITAIILGGVACSEAPESRSNSTPAEPATFTSAESILHNEVQLRWTEHGIPHIKANSWEGLGYGFAYAFASNTICVLAREVVTGRGEQGDEYDGYDDGYGDNGYGGGGGQYAQPRGRGP